MQKPIKSLYAFLIITIIGGGVTFGLLKYQNNFSDDITKKENKTVSGKPLPTEFREPSPDGLPHIVGAEIERITIPECKDCYADIIKKMDGVPDETIIKINNQLTSGIFETDKVNDIRNPKNRLKGNIESMGTINGPWLQEKIVYLDSKNKILNYWQTDGSYISPKVGAYSYFVLSNDYKKRDSQSILFTQGIDSDETVVSDILEYFYPNFNELYITEDVSNVDTKIYGEFCGPYEEGSTLAERRFPLFSLNFYPTVNFNTQEVIFTESLGGAGRGCYAVSLAIPISDILKEVSQYVPKDSVLWKFME